MGLIERWRKFVGADVERDSYPITLDDLVGQMGYLGQTYTFPIPSGSLEGAPYEKVGDGFTGYIAGAYKANGVVFACMLARQMLFSEARFQYRQLNNGRPGKLFGTSDLAVLERPWPGGTTGDLLSRMIVDADIAGNAFILREGDRLARLRPDWVLILYDRDPWDPAAAPVGYAYTPGGPASGNKPITYAAEQVTHFAPLPDPLSPWRGMSWLTPVLREIDADQSATTHKQQMFEKGGTPNVVIKFDATVRKDLFDAYVKALREEHEGAQNAYKWLFLGGGADAQVVGANLQQLDFKATQGAGETRIAAASGIHPVILGLSEGLAGASLNAGNFNSARRLTADKTLRPLWRNVCGSLEKLVETGQVRNLRAQLWYDELDIAFLREDEKDAAEIQQVQAVAIRQLIDGGFDPPSVVEAVVAGDLSLLKHSGLLSVQLQEPGAELDTQSQNGKVPDALNAGV